ncbi:MAG: hypothetical protein FWJ85_11245, partial [Solitalea sp.]
MKLNFTSRKRLARIASFLFTLLFVAGAAFSSYAQQPMERVYASTETHSNRLTVPIVGTVLAPVLPDETCNLPTSQANG